MEDKEKEHTTHRSHEDRKRPMRDHPTGHLGYTGEDNLEIPDVKGAGDEKKRYQRKGRTYSGRKGL